MWKLENLINGSRRIKQYCISNWLYIVGAFTIIGVFFTIGRIFLIDIKTAENNRPSVAIENVCWGRIENDDWFGCLKTFTNYGNIPAEQFQYRNFRVIVFNINKAEIIKRLKEKEGTSQYLELHTLDEKNRLSLALMNELFIYFKKNPDSNCSNTINFISSLLGKKSFKGSGFFSLIEVNNDMNEYFDKQEFIIPPNKPMARSFTEQVGKNGLRRVVEDDNLLAIYLAVKYKGPSRSKEYSTYYLGFTDKDFIEASPLRIPFDQFLGIPVREFRTWTR